MAHENLSNPLIPLAHISDLICFADFTWMYLILESIYSINIKKKLEYCDLKNIYLSRLDERILFALDNFDSTQKVPEPTPEFFIKLKKIKYKDKKTEKFFRKISFIKRFIHFDILGYFPSSKFQIVEYYFLTFLAGCSAVNNGRDEINEYDVIKANKTYLKLMQTDITKYKAIDKSYKPEINPSVKSCDGYLVCQKCNGYYKLQPGESPDNFDLCQCGGTLKHVMF